MAGLIDPTVAGDYPVILGDSLLGKTSNEIFTGIRYNHKPELSSSDAPNHARLKPSIPGKTASYDLSYTENEGSYAYAGTRTVDDNQYVLYFDPERKAFILDKVDSTFNMNVTRLPGNSDPDKLSRQYAHLEIDGTTKDDTAPKPTPKPRAKSPVQNKEAKRKPTKKQAKKMVLSLPEPEQPKPKPVAPAKTQDDDEDEDDDDDGGLLVEYPGADITARQTDFSPAFPQPRRFDDFINQRESDDGGDADGESEDEPDADFKLPSPVNHHVAKPEHMEEDKSDDDGATADLENDLENDLEKEMEIAFEDLSNSQQESPGDESEISEED